VIVATVTKYDKIMTTVIYHRLGLNNMHKGYTCIDGGFELQTT